MEKERLRCLADYYLCQLCDIVTIYRKYNGTDYYSCYEGNRILLLLAVSSAMVSDAVEYGEWKTKIRVEGLTFSMQGFVGTIAAGIVTAVIGWVLNFSKYDGTLSFADTQAGSAVFAIKLLFIAVPFVVGVLNIILLRFYKLDKMYPQIIEDLNKRNGK